MYGPGVGMGPRGLCEPYERQVAQLDGIPGFGVRTAQDLIGEIGVDMAAFPTAGHLCSWARLAPRVRESAGRRKGKNATGRGNPCIGGTLGEAAAGAEVPCRRNGPGPGLIGLLGARRWRPSQRGPWSGHLSHAESLSRHLAGDRLSGRQPAKYSE